MAVFVSPERRYRRGLAVVIAVIAVVQTAAGSHTPGGLAAGVVVALVAVAYAHGCGRVRLLADADGLTDHRLVRAVQVPWADVADLVVERPAGPWGGYCVQVETSSGDRRELLSTRAYSRFPIGDHYDQLHQIAWTLKSLRPTSY